MPITILVPQALAKRCYLPEALLWTAVLRFPLAEQTERGIDARESRELLEWPEPRDHYLDAMTDEECLRAGLPTNPTYEEMLSGEVHLEADTLRGILSFRVENRDKLAKDLEASIEFHERRDRWNRECTTFLDLYKAKLFVGLREGQLEAFGKALSQASYSQSIDELEDEGLDDWLSKPWVRIPSSFWISSGIDWENSFAEGRGVAQALILVETQQLLQRFPPPPAMPSKEVTRIGDTYVVSENATSQLVRRSSRGRPSLLWDDFHVEIARRIQRGDLPGKQEAFIAEMQAWCRRSWKREVGRSTVLQKVKPYYDALVRKSEKKD